MGNFTGTATCADRVLRIDWQTADGAAGRAVTAGAGRPRARLTAPGSAAHPRCRAPARVPPSRPIMETSPS